ncbi:MAG TPA: IS1182 family transposase [Tepidisphaeraceae bacterium]|nr:IS1182 family transposase [Tepidisphaeraceae bacterium]
MAKTFREWNVQQQMLLPPSVLDFVPPGHLAHFLRDTVAEELDLAAIVDAYEEERGYPPYHPVMMTALLLYAYCQRLYSSRRIARACEERVDFMAVTALQQPDFRTIAAFRRRHLPALQALFQQVLGLCQRAGLVRLGHVALDGTKIRANASKHKAMSYRRMQEREPALAAEVARWLREAEATDTREDAAHGPEQRGDELPAWVANKQERLAKIRAAKAALEAEARAAAPPATPSPPPAPTAQRNFTDPESRIMKGPDGYVQAYNVQIAVDAASQVIVAEHVTAAATDVQALPVLLAQIKANTGRQARELSADAGYCSAANLRELRRRHIRGYVAVGRQRHGQRAPEAPRPLPRGSLLAAMRTRLRRAGHRSRYRLRKMTAEPVFGQIKAVREFRQFLLRGLRKVQGEFTLVAIAHNFLKLAAARAG